MDIEAGRVTARSTAPASSFRLWYMAAILCLTNAVSFVDRQSLPLLINQIKGDFEINDTQVSLLVGFAFILTYAGLSIPAGILVDRFSRRAVLSAGIGFWSASTMFCSFATSYWMMFVGRLGIGAGESVVGPGAASIIRDAFAPDQRGRAVAIWAMGANIGAAAALLLGGLILRAVGDAPSITLPLFGTVRSWQVVLFGCALITMPVALLVLTFREPPRTGTMTPERSGMGAAIAFMAQRWKVFALVFLVNGLTIIMTVPHGIWAPAMFERVWKLSRPEIAFTLGIMTLVFGASSQFIAGTVLDRLERAGVANPVPLFGIIVCVLAFLPGVYMPLAPNVTTAWVLQAIYMLIATSLFTIGTAFITRLAPPEMAGKITSLHFLWMGLIGTLVGTTLYAVVADTVYGHAGPLAIAYSLSTVVAILTVLSIVVYLLLMLLTRKESAKSP
ncbi:MULTISPECIES: MFS transporter [unclassified Beijerinckia]|uniref:MFS transporter n=1 Tax=unclassified Beijerinckia TaxID=2638183 RepID=UPI000896809B|nr:MULTISPECIES: MFS transporter [unclassified Beijerinckia]MDH7796712.1 MFS family permease [Beijerinckia sp. GAS462]SEC56781.1 Sugar phosphate permease [Beijerinckia sp. 28-YEA-48]